MLRQLRNNQGQAMLAEYGAALLLVVAAVVAITMFFKRSVQGRINDANTYMMEQIRTQAGNAFVGTLQNEYEPYYTDTNSTISSDTDRTTILSGGGVTGIFDKIVEDTRTITSEGETLPPKDVGNTGP